MKEQIKNKLAGILFAAITFSFLLLRIPVYAAEPENTVLEQAKIKVMKVDSIANVGIPGAAFGIYRDEACTDVITDMPETDENGESEQEITVTQDTVYLKEITAPSGYRQNSTVYPAGLAAGQTISVTIPGEERMMSLDITSKGHVLTDAEANDEGVEFRYWRSMEREGAVFNVHAGEDIVTPYGTVIYRQGDLIAENLETGDKGVVTVSNLHRGTYRITSVCAPYKYYNARQRKTISNSYLDPETDEWAGNAIFYFDRQKAKVSVAKTDKETSTGVAGAVFGLYAAEDIQNEFGDHVLDKDALIEIATTDVDGTITFTEEIPAGFGYYVKEEQPPEGYQKNTEVYSFRYDYINDEAAEVEFSHTFASARSTASIHLFRTDLETNQSQGDATLQNAVYGLYARNDILRPDLKSEILYKAGEQAGTLVTNQKGEAQIENLYLGEYFIKELTPSEGYLPDETEYDISCDYEGEQVLTVEKSCHFPEQVIKQPFQVIKTANAGESDEVISGAGFTAYLVSSLVKKENGEYDLDASVPVVIGEQGETEIFTDENGCASSIPLPYGTYLIRETTTPPNTDPVNEFTIQITEHNPDKPQVCRVYPEPTEDKTHTAIVSIKKTDIRDNKTIEGAELQVTDIEGNIIETWTSQNAPHIIKELTAGESYQLTELSPAEGYVTAERITFIPIATDKEKTQEIEMWADITKVEITKIGLSGNPVSGAKLSIMDEAGNTIESWISENKAHYMEKLPIGEYTLREENTPEGYLAAEDIPFKVLDTGAIQRIIMGSKEALPENPEIPDSDRTDSEISDSKAPDSSGDDFETTDSKQPDSDSVDSETSTSKIPDSKDEDSEAVDVKKPDSDKADSETLTSGKPDEKPQEQNKQTESTKQETQQSKQTDQEIASINSPKTGDEITVLFWLVISLLAICLLICSFAFLSYRKK